MRNGTLDHARLIAAVGIVVFHTGAPGAWLGYAALPFFLMLLILLAWPAAERQDFKSYVWSRWGRLTQPWALWSLIYGVLKLAEVMLTDRTLAEEFAPWMLATGPVIHLWFLPFALAACLAVWPLAKGMSHQSDTARVGLAACLSAGAVAVLIWHADAGELPPPLAQWTYAVPAVFLGAALALVGPRRGLVMLLVTMLILVWVGWPNGSLQNGVAGAALIGCMALPTAATPASRLASDLSLPLYLVHPLVAAVLLRLSPLPESSVILALATLSASLVAVLVLHVSSRYLLQRAETPA